ncbi:patatin-like phospholipase family protein [Microbulbifer variabilis]|uniref:patatin-like phospholipase family protein n=1 Tax=Microbulbifer variabilis TaxID=266805 RepID=UPI001CFC798D|nr:patatin-like phospholipase family protein [Microbulbifer variabilis]
MKIWRLTLFIFLLLAGIGSTFYIYNHRFTEKTKFHRIPVTEETIIYEDHLREKETINILILDGGGIRGLIPLYVLQYIEQRVGKPINEMFDVFSGVSTGAIIATGINIPSKQLQKQYGDYGSKVDLLIKLYKSESKYLFSTPWYHKLLTGAGLLSPKFMGDRLHQVLKFHYTESLKFTDLENYVIIPSLDIYTGKIHLFKNRGREIIELPSNSVYQLVIAASSAEAVFPPVDFMTLREDLRHRYFADAAVSDNDPTSMILLDIIEQFPNKNYYILILGSGTSPLSSAKDSYQDVKNWGRLQWLPDIITDIQRSMDTQQLYALRIAQLLSPKGRIEFDYLNVKVANPKVGIFDYESMDSLKIHADRLIEENKAAVDQTIKHLKKSSE